jgi:acetyl-CoA carboxylase alpha subunit
MRQSSSLAGGRYNFQEDKMTETNLIDQIIDETRKSHNKVSDIVTSQVKNLLEGEFAKRKFTAAEIKRTAEQLIANLNTAERENHENKND